MHIRFLGKQIYLAATSYLIFPSLLIAYAFLAQAPQKLCAKVVSSSLNLFYV